MTLADDDFRPIDNYVTPEKIQENRQKNAASMRVNTEAKRTSQHILKEVFREKIKAPFLLFKRTCIPEKFHHELPFHYDNYFSVSTTEFCADFIKEVTLIGVNHPMAGIFPHSNFVGDVFKTTESVFFFTKLIISSYFQIFPDLKTS